MPLTIHTIETIVSDPAVRGGRPCIRGTGLRVSDVAAQAVFHGQNPDEIAAGFAVPLADIYAVLSYFYDHQDEIRGEWERDAAFFDEMKNRLRCNAGSTP